LAVALVEMAVRSGVGFKVSEIADHRALFSEAPSRVVACVPERHVAQVSARAGAAGGAAIGIGVSGGDLLEVDGLLRLTLAEATARWRGALPEAISAPTAAAVGK
jgi:phosphoribosylformylglycinamidine (FGAM) synthase-like enzyme